MKPVFATAGTVAATLALTAALLWVDPFAQFSAVLDAAFGAAPQWTQVSNLSRDPHTQEISHGENPRAGLDFLAGYWRGKAGERVVILGNSQTFSVSLAPGELPRKEPEPTYPDLVAAHLAQKGALGYRLAAPGLSYSEALWCLEYLLSSPALTPSTIVLQVNYQAFWNGGIRASMQDLLRTPEFRARIDRLAGSGQAYAEGFGDALRKWDVQRSQTAAAGAPQAGFGPRLEKLARGWLAAIPLFHRRPLVKDSFAQLLYRMRLYFLRIKPSNARSIDGPRMTQSQAAIEEIARECQTGGVRLILLVAPVNPSVSLYRSKEDKARYEDFVQTVATGHGLTRLDLENAVEAPLWGRQLNSPDPLHLGRRGHEAVSERVVATLDAAAAGGL
jgi:hypothetical protein